MAETHHTPQTDRAGGVEPEHDEHHEPHAVSFRLLFAIFAALLVLTWATVAVAQLNLGRYDLLVAMAIAVAKGALVVTVFMHLWWDSRVNAIALVSALAFVALLIGTSSMDVGQYKPQKDAYRIDNPPAAIEAATAAEPQQAGGEAGGAEAGGSREGDSEQQSAE